MERSELREEKQKTGSTQTLGSKKVGEVSGEGSKRLSSEVQAPVRSLVQSAAGELFLMGRWSCVGGAGGQMAGWTYLKYANTFSKKFFSPGFYNIIFSCNFHSFFFKYVFLSFFFFYFLLQLFILCSLFSISTYLPSLQVKIVLFFKVPPIQGRDRCRL